MRILNQLVLFGALSSLGYAQSPIGYGKELPSPSNWIDVKPKQPAGIAMIGDYDPFTMWMANAMLPLFPDTAGQPLWGIGNDGSIGGTGLNLGMYQLSRLPTFGVTPTSDASCQATPSTCNVYFTPAINFATNGGLSSFRPNGSETWPPGNDGACNPGDGPGNHCTWKGNVGVSNNNILEVAPYRQLSNGNGFGASSPVLSPDAGQTWIGYEGWNAYTITAGSCSSSVVSLTLTSVSGLSNGTLISIHDLVPSGSDPYAGAVGYGSKQTITNVAGSVIQYTLKDIFGTTLSCPGTAPTGGNLGILVPGGSAPTNTAGTMMWPYTQARGLYSSGTTYNQGDLATDVSIVYVSLQNGNIGHTPASSPTFWTVVGPVPGTGPPTYTTNIMGHQMPFDYGQDLTWSAGIEPYCDPHMGGWVCGLTTDAPRTSFDTGYTYLFRYPVLPRGAGFMNKSLYQLYYCPTQTPFWGGTPGETCDPNNSGSWTSIVPQASQVLYTNMKNGANARGVRPGETFSSQFFPEFKQYVSSNISASNTGGLRQSYYSSPHPNGPWEPLGNSECTEVNSGCTAFFNAISWGRNVVSATPPRTQVWLASKTDGSGNGLGFGGVEFAPGVQYFINGMNRRAEYMSTFGQLGMGHRFTSGPMAGAIPKRGSGWSFDWWMDNWDGGNSGEATGKPYFRDLLTNGDKFFLVSYNDGNLCCDFSHGWSLTTTGPSLSASPGYSNGEYSSFVDSVFSANSGNAAWTFMATANLSTLNSLGTGGTFISSGTFSGTGVPSTAQIKTNVINAGDLCVSWGRVSDATKICTPGGVITTGQWYFIAVSADAAHPTGTYPTITIYVGTLGVLTTYGPSTLTKTCTTHCTDTPSVTAGGLTIGFDTGSGYLSGLYGDFALASGVIPGNIIAGIFKTLQMDYKATGRGQLEADSVIITSKPQQLVISYDATCSPCTIKVATDPGLTQLAADVDPAIFTNADQDTSRPSCLIDGIHHVCVIGQRTADLDLAGGGHRTSRSLQVFTTYYVQVNGGRVQQTSTPTAVVGSTIADLPNFDIPTVVSANRNTQLIIDPQTGFLMKPLSLIDDLVVNSGTSNTAGAYMNSSGYTRHCTLATTGPGPGYLCAYPDDASKGGPSLIYYVIPSTGEVRYQGASFDVGKFNNLDNKAYGFCNVSALDFRLCSFTLHDTTYAAVPQGSFANFDSVVISSLTPQQMMAAYDPTFPTYGGTAVGHTNGVYNSGTNTTVLTAVAPLTFNSNMVGHGMKVNNGGFQCITYTDSTHITVRGDASGFWPFWESQGGPLAEGPYIMITFPVHDADSYASVAIYEIATNSIIAASRFSTSPGACGGWCGMHNFQIMPDTPTLTNFEGHVLNGASGYGSAVYYSTTTATINPSDTTFTINGTPSAPGQVDSFLKNWQVTDTVRINDGVNTELAVITAIPDSTHITVTGRSGSNTFASGTHIEGWCNGIWLWYWQFLLDPTGSDLTNTYFTNPPGWPFGGHDDWGTNARISETYDAMTGPIFANLLSGTNYSQTQAPFFAGLQPNGFGNTFQLHPSYQQYAAPSNEQGWFLDAPSYQASQNIAPFTNLGGAGYLWKTSSAPASYWNPKVFDTYAAHARTQMVDASGPVGSVPLLTNALADVGKYCVALNAGECFAGSSANDIYAVLPLSTTTGSCVSPAVDDVCVGSVPGHGQGAIQLGNLLGTPSKRDRIVTMGLTTWRNMAFFASSKPLSDGSWAQFGFNSSICPSMVSPPCQTTFVWLAKLPPYTVTDALDRTTFLRPSIAITNTAGGTVASAVVEFGYAEYGAPSQHYCRSRQEPCWAVNSLTTDSNPLGYPSENPTKTLCSSNCSIQIPVLPNRVAYYTVKFYTAGGAFVANGKSGVCAETTCTELQ